jgi:hypothetical protein
MSSSATWIGRPAKPLQRRTEIHATYETIDQQPALRFERRIAHPIESVWRFELDPLGEDASTLRFTVLIDTKDKAARDAAGWHVCLDGLERLLDGAEGDVSHGVTDTWLERYEDYVERGLPSGAPIPAA